MKYPEVESFNIPTVGRYIIRNERRFNVKGVLVEGFIIYAQGSAIGHPTTLAEARCIIHDHAKEQLARIITNCSMKLQCAEEAQFKLGSDVFCLGKFMVDTDYETK